MTAGNNPRRIKTTDTVTEIIAALHEMDGATLAELARELDYAKSTLYSHLRTLEDKEYVAKTGDEYLLSLRFLSYGMYAKNRFDVSRVGQPVIDNLAEETEEVAWIIVEQNGRAVYLNKAMGEKAIQTHASIGGRGYLHHLATGKVILAHLPEERIDEIIDQHGLPKLTPHTITDSDELKEELVEIRRKEIAMNDKETLEGLRAVGAPVLCDGIRGAVCVSGPANRLTVERCLNDIKPLLLEATNEIELKLQYPPK